MGAMTLRVVLAAGAGIAALLWSAETAGAAAAAAATEKLHAGLAVVDITPPLGYRMSGYFHERLATGVKNPLRAKALVLRQGKVQAAMVFCDVIGLSPGISARTRKQAQEATGIPAANILLSATHTHTGPLYSGALRARFHKEALAKHGKDPYEAEDYPAKLVAGIVKAIQAAQAAQQPVKLEAGRARQEGLSFNRRFHMKTGPVRFNPGVLNPDIVKAAGPIDPEVGIVLLKDSAGRPAASLTNFALHLDTVGGTEYAADYPYYLEQTLRGKLGKEFISLFGTGTCGDINHIDVTRKERLKTDHIGQTLGRTVLAALAGLKAQTPSLAAASKTVGAPVQQYDAEEIAQAEADMALVGSGKLPFLRRVKAYKIAALRQRGGKAIPLEVQVFRLSDGLAVVGLPGEVFVDLGLAIKRASPFAATLVIELCQDAPGYLPTAKAFAEGSYETVNSRIAPGGAEQMAAAAVELLKELAPKGSE